MDVPDRELQRQIEMENRAHMLRLKMYQDAAFMASVRDGLAADARDDVITLEELDAQRRAKRQPE